MNLCAERQGCQQAAGAHEGAERALEAGHVQSKGDVRFSRNAYLPMFLLPHVDSSCTKQIFLYIFLQIPYFSSTVEVTAC
jgi:hypothetical protein